MWEILGLEPMMRSAMTYNHLSHRSAPGQAFLDAIEELGPREAVAQRDAAFGGTQRTGGRLPLLEGPDGSANE
jgi:hypothetical protein